MTIFFNLKYCFAIVSLTVYFQGTKLGLILKMFSDKTAEPMLDHFIGVLVWLTNTQVKVHLSVCNLIYTNVD